MTETPQTLEAVGLGKRFGSFVALDDVSLTLGPGRVHALLGENGAGKSTLVKCIMGYHRPDTGEVRLGGRPLRARGPREAQSAGIGMVYQHFTLVPAMTVAENLVLSRARLPFFVDWKKENDALARFFAQTTFKLPQDARVASLTAGERQKLEIAKQLYLGSRIVILDEPTSVLTPAEADDVLGHLRCLATAGELSILLITHKFREVKAFADDVTVLRRGRVVGRGLAADLPPAALAEMMVGRRPPEASVSTSTASAPGKVILRIEGLAARDDRGLPALRGVDLDVRAGEIVGVAAVAGNGQEALVEVLAGQRRRTKGRALVNDVPYEPTREEIHRHGVRCLPEEPLLRACVPGMTIVENLALRGFDRAPLARFRAFPSRRRIAAEGRIAMTKLGVRAPSPETPIERLSGGNVQRVVLARELAGDQAARLLVVANPCMGLDFEAVAEIHTRIRSARERGAAVLLVSADLDEIFALADRIVVMSQGRVVHETTTAAADLAIIGAHMAGHAETAHA